MGVSDTADVELSFEHDAFVWMSTPDILTAVAADEMMVGHHTVYFLQQLLAGAEDILSMSAETFDAEGDGDLDLAVTNWGSNNISVILNNGSGNYGAASHFGVGTQPLSVFAYDADGDGDVDLAAANAGSNNISISRYIPLSQLSHLNNLLSIS